MKTRTLYVWILACWVLYACGGGGGGSAGGNLTQIGATVLNAVNATTTVVVTAH